MIQDQNLVRRMEACETMGGANFICTDKTGTLTKNEMTIVNIYDGEKDISLKSLYQSGDQKQIKVQKPTDLFNPDFYELFKLVSCCNTNSEFNADGTETSTHKTDLAFTKVMRIYGENVKKLRDNLIGTHNNKKMIIPFSSNRKKMSVIVRSNEFPQGYRMLIKGGSEIVLPACNYYRDGGRITELSPQVRKRCEEKIVEYAKMTLRTVVIGYKELSTNDIQSWDKTESRQEGKDFKEIHPIEESGFVLIGIIGIMDILKEGVEKAVIDCQEARINVIMVTGDNITTACAIADSCSIRKPKGKGPWKGMLGSVNKYLYQGLCS